MNKFIDHIQFSIISCIVKLSQYTFLGSSKNSFCAQTRLESRNSDTKDYLLEAKMEASRFFDFFRYFKDVDVLKKIEGSTILDFGCGFGGRAVALAKLQNESKVFGVDVHRNKMVTAEGYSLHENVKNAAFKLCVQDEIPFHNGYFDNVLSYDVIEHVHYPELTMEEIYRVLRPGGHAYIVFPSYFGAVSHHLDFITLFPGLHWFFSANTLMRSINKILQSDYGKRFSTPPQSLGQFSKYAKKDVLPSLNGLSTATFLEVANKFELVSLHKTPLMDKSPKKIKSLTQLNLFFMRLFPWWSDHLSFNIVVILKKI